MNLLLIAPIKSPVLLIIELLLFIPIILICFTWWYWRINHGRSERNLSPAIIVMDGPGALEYFFFAAEVCFGYPQDSCKTSISKMVRLLNGFVVLDFFGLTLSRAVDLAIDEFRALNLVSYSDLRWRLDPIDSSCQNIGHQRHQDIGQFF